MRSADADLGIDLALGDHVGQRRHRDGQGSPRARGQCGEQGRKEDMGLLLRKR